MSSPPPEKDSQNRIVAVTLDEESIERSGPDIEHERAIAIYDLTNRPVRAGKAQARPFHAAYRHHRQPADVRHKERGPTPVVAHLLSLTPFRRIVKDYFMICDSYYEAIRTATPDRSRPSHGPPRHP